MKLTANISKLLRLVTHEMKRNRRKKNRVAANVKVFMKLWQLKNVSFNSPQKQNSDL
jgi:hypothetical protein